MHCSFLRRIARTSVVHDCVCMFCESELLCHQEYTVVTTEIQNNRFGQRLRFFWCGVTGSILFSQLWMLPVVQLFSHRNGGGGGGCVTLSHTKESQ